MLQTIKTLALLGGEWVLILLLFLSLWGFAVACDRFLFFRSRYKGAEAFETAFQSLLKKGSLADLRSLKGTSPEARVLMAGLENLSLDQVSLEAVLESAKTQERLSLEKNLLVLGTLGNNAPFIGLFGTVLGIIKAFNDLAVNGTAGPSVVMRGVSEALVATAVGLLIAIPSVAAYNFFQGRIRRSMMNADRMGKLLLAHRTKGKR